MFDGRRPTNFCRRLTSREPQKGSLDLCSSTGLENIDSNPLISHDSRKRKYSLSFSSVNDQFGSRAASPTGTCIAGGTVQ